MAFETKDKQNKYRNTETEEEVFWEHPIYRNIKLIKANYLIGRIEDKGRALWMVFIDCLRKYCQVYHCVILYVLQCASGLCKIVFNIDKRD